MLFWATVFVVRWQSASVKRVRADGAEFYRAAPSELMNNGELISTALKNPPPPPLGAAERIKTWKRRRGKSTKPVFPLFALVGLFWCEQTFILCYCRLHPSQHSEAGWWGFFFS